MTDEFPRNSKLPGVIVTLKSVAPRGQGTQSRFSPGGGTHIHDSRISAAQNRGEIDDSPPQPLAEPRRALMTPVIHPLRLRPFVRAPRKHDRLAFEIAQRVFRANRSRVPVILSPR